MKKQIIILAAIGCQFALASKTAKAQTIQDINGSPAIVTTLDSNSIKSTFHSKTNQLKSERQRIKMLQAQITTAQTNIKKDIADSTQYLAEIKKHKWNAK